MTRPESYLWDGRSLVPASHETEPTIIDSFVVDQGTMRGALIHIARFSGSACLRCGVSPDTLARFAWAVGNLLREQSAFARIESDSAGRLCVRLRELPPIPNAIGLWVGHLDQRTDPRHKGPDLARCQRLREAALANGADAGAFFVRSPGDRELVEADYAALIGYVDGALVTSSSTARLPSVTEQLLRAAAAEHGQPQTRLRLSVELVRKHPFWIANARVGLVPATILRLDDAPASAVPVPADAERTRRWRNWLMRQSESIDANAWAEAAHRSASAVIQSS